MGESPSFLDALRQDTAKRCVGREGLKARLLERYRERSRNITMLVGPAGIGKTTLIHWLCGQLPSTAKVAWVSGEQIAPNAEALLSGLRVTHGGDTGLSELGRGPSCDLLVVDSFEKLSPLAPWLFRQLLGELGANLMVVIASRERLPAIERTQLGIADHCEETELGPLTRAEAEAMLRGMQLDAHRHAALVDFARGHPLALQLAAVRASSGSSQVAEGNSAVLEELVRAFAASAPTPLHRRALYAASVARVIDASLLSAMVDEGAAATLFDWLRRSALMERTDLGLSAHELVREALFEDLTRSDPELLVQLQVRLVDVMAARMLSHDPSTAHDLHLQAVYANRNRAQVSHYAGVESPGRCSVVGLHGGALSEAHALVRRFEGEEGVASFETWLRREHLSAAIVDPDGRVAAFQMVLRVPFERDEGALSDALIRRSWELWRARAPVPEHGDLYLFRWFMQRESYQQLTGGMAHLFTLGPIITYPNLPNINHIAFANAPPELWDPLAPSFQLEGVPGEVTLFAGRRHNHVFGSLRQMLGELWSRPDRGVAGMCLHLRRQFGLPVDLAQERSSAPELLTAEALGRGLAGLLASLQAPSGSAAHPIARWLASRGGPQDREGLIRWVMGGIQALAAAPKSKHLAEVLMATYFSTSQKQLAAASDLGLPFGTYRYQLRKALELLSHELWQRSRDARSAPGGPAAPATREDRSIGQKSR